MLGTSENPLRVAIVGAGPSGFYAAGHLLKNKQHPELVAEVDLFDKLPTPFGLVRAGVAPDHPKIKSVTRVYEKSALDPRFRFYGGVELGRDLSREELLAHYHAVIYTVGAQADRKLWIDGEDLPGSVPATEFVAWYNGHPDAAGLEFDLSAERAVVIGNGNVAIDVARMLLLTREELSETDTADHAIEAIAGSGIREVVICGRRGPAQSAFTNPEILELGVMEGVDVVVDPADLELDEHSAASLDQAGEATARKNVEILREYAARPLSGAAKRIVFRFFASPTEIQGDGKVERVVLERNALVAEGGQLRAKPTGETETLDCGLVFRAVGYKGVELAGIPFEERSGLIRNEAGRVTDEAGNHLHGEYTAGWIKRGPSGVIGTNKKCAVDTVTELLHDLTTQHLNDPADADPATIDALVRERVPSVVAWNGWKAIDAVETAAGEPHGRPRVKLVTYDALHEAA
ncbi:MAG: FAD-dependent oxidoreductase, partial [Solirubrobacteraceae bacterium]|nr:FAD-dependent oxidoreductase [Solirubrobacteraceae bacterium]